jgi:hypothetical protein
MLNVSEAIARIWQRWVGSSEPPPPPALRLFIAPLSPAPSWHPAKASDGARLLQVVVHLEAKNTTDHPIRIASARLRDHAVEQATFTIGLQRGDARGRDFAVPARRMAHVMVMFFVKGARYAPGEAFSDAVLLCDEQGREHRLKITVRGR